ncbi:hypothetical protein EZ428_13875 [Pedobacter frigiditerrae]|uniref:PAS domain-containing protein n=1 Tax=Pedobacter frigiditerrae TaxID=2530452 RepID=A0A4R0MTJ9_9SPHI|nr:hypothetical protein [Pedobacter frigiditerrae]TCC90360.1 hypothetical protein EZ428_13875 [Pedobacter frigiditerrae]
MKAKTKLRYLFVVFICGLSINSFAQKKPDTLIIGTKNGQILLVSDSLQKFNGLMIEEIIKKALLSVKDSLTSEDKKARNKVMREAQYTELIKNKNPFRINPFFGIGLIRDKLSPFLGLSLDFAPQRQDYYYKKGGMYTFINVAINSFFSFSQNPSGYRTQKNIFLEASIGNRMNNKLIYKSFSEISGGIGYLVHREGNYFKGNSFKVYCNFGLPNSFVKIRPELFITDNFRTAFPGLAIKFN